MLLFIFIIVCNSKDMCSCKSYAKQRMTKRQPVGKSSYKKNSTIRSAKTVPNLTTVITEQNEHTHGM